MSSMRNGTRNEMLEIASVRVFCRASHHNVRRIQSVWCEEENMHVLTCFICRFTLFSNRIHKIDSTIIA